RRAFLGIAGGNRPLPPAIAQRLGRKAGVEVQEVVAGSPAAAASLRSGDIIVSVGEVAVAKAGDLQRLMVEARIGARIPLTLLRSDKLVTVDVVPAELSYADRLSSCRSRSATCFEPRSRTDASAWPRLTRPGRRA